MNNRDTIEYYDGNRLVASCVSSMVPVKGDKISIKGVTWEVVSVTYALDHSDDNLLCGMRANVDISEA